MPDFNIILPEENLQNILINNLHEVLIPEPYSSPETLDYLTKTVTYKLY